MCRFFSAKAQFFAHLGHFSSLSCCTKRDGTLLGYSVASCVVLPPPTPMSQTIMATLALAVATLLSVTIQKSTVSARLSTVHAEFEMLAGTVALDVLDHINSQAFDAATHGTTVTDPSSLTALPFTEGKQYASADDIDDFHKMQTYTYATGYSNVSFDVDVEVIYVSETDPSQASLTQTFAKAVTVTIDHDYLNTPVEMSQVFTYP